MKFILKIKPNNSSKKKRIVAWIPKSSDFDKDIQELFHFFKDNIKISKFSKILRYYIATSKNPAVMLNLFSSIQELIPEVYFNEENSIKLEDFVDL
ncbi:MAG: hypothetical protein JSV23_00860 [Promethearchaeota archaeon]|nr:MAG: hypothetical protein JSV23_00860 [Candidatus Lokiarchaeota archaeon]